MAHIEYLLHAKQQEKHILRVTWQGIAYTGGELSVALDAEQIGIIPDKKTLRAGQEFTLADGTTFTVTIEGRYITAESNGKVLSAFTQPKDIHVHMRAYYITYFIGAYTWFKGAAMLLFFSVPAILGFELYWLVTGALFIALGYYVKRGSAAALTVALLYLILDTASLFIMPIQNTFWTWTMVMVHLTLMYPLIAGLFAMNRYKRRNT